MITFTTALSEAVTYDSFTIPYYHIHRDNRDGYIMVVLRGPAGSKELKLAFADIPERIIVPGVPAVLDELGNVVTPAVPEVTEPAVPTFTNFYAAYTTEDHLYNFAMQLLQEQYNITLSGIIDLTGEAT